VKLYLAPLLASLLILPACNRNEPRSTEAASEQRTAPTDQLKQERDDYAKAMDARLAEFDKKVDGLSERADVMTGTAKSNFKGLLDQLRDERKGVVSKLDDLKSVNPESWMTLKGEVDSAMAGLDHAYDQVAARFPTPTR
jgi:hypothetical protein